MSNSKNIILVDENDQMIGNVDLISAHAGTGMRHRAASVFLVNAKGELLLQQRSEKKIVGALQWANTCCGNVRVGESYEECAHRRLREELGITNVHLLPLYKFEYHVQCNEKYSEWEMDQVFIGRYEAEVQPNPDEVVDTLWWEFGNVETLLSEETKQFAPWFILMKDRVRGSVRAKFFSRN